MNTTTLTMDSKIQKLINLQWLYYQYRNLGRKKQSDKENKQGK